MPQLGDPETVTVIDFTEKWAHIVRRVGHVNLHEFLPVTNLFDRYGRDTTNWARARAGVCGEGSIWVNFDVDEPPMAVH
jgi:hypothetical protein